MSHRRRGLLFAVASGIAALIAAAAVARHEETLTAGEGALRPVLVAATPLAPGRPIKPGQLEVRRFPASFVAPEVLSDPAALIGRRAAVLIPAGAYLLPSFVREEGHNEPTGHGPSRLRGTPVEISVAGAGALRPLVGGRVDVLVTRDSPHGFGGSTRVAVPGARLLGLDPDGLDGGWTATLAVSRDQALQLIEAGSYARELRLIASAR